MAVGVQPVERLARPGSRRRRSARPPRRRCRRARGVPSIAECTRPVPESVTAMSKNCPRSALTCSYSSRLNASPLAGSCSEATHLQAPGQAQVAGHVVPRADALAGRAAARAPSRSTRRCSRSASVPASGFASRATTRSPRCSASTRPRQAATVVFPTPPLIDVTATRWAPGSGRADAVQQRRGGASSSATGPGIDQAAGPRSAPSAAEPCGSASSSALPGRCASSAQARARADRPSARPDRATTGGPATTCLETVPVVVPPRLGIGFDAPRAIAAG